MLDNILLVFGALVGWPLLVALVIDILKLLGVVKDGEAGRWNLGLNLLGFIGVGIAIGFYPDIDIVVLDARLAELVQVAAYIVTVLTQIFATRIAHAAFLKTETGKKYLSFSSYESELNEINNP